MVNVSLEELVKAGAHFGHQVKRWNPKMEPYIYGVSDGVHVFDLIKTKEELEKALNVITETVKAGKKILIVGTKKQAKEKVEELAREVGINWVSERWLGGTLTNFDQIKRSVKKLADMKTAMTNGEYAKYTKKERLLLDREILRLERFFGGLAGLETYPDLLIVIDTKREKGAVDEAAFRGIETIGIVDTNSDPTTVDWPIPMNDDASRALEYVLELFKEAIDDGRKTTKKSSISSSGNSSTAGKSIKGDDAKSSSGTTSNSSIASKPKSKTKVDQVNNGSKTKTDPEVKPKKKVTKTAIK